MRKFLKYIEALSDTDAQPIANIAAITVLLLGAIFCVRIVIAAQPYHYQVQCKAPANSDSRVTLVSRRTALITVGPAPDATGMAAITSDRRFEDYDVTFEGGPCRYVEGK
jgi:hypothetical protein